MRQPGICDALPHFSLIYPQEFISRSSHPRGKHVPATIPHINPRIAVGSFFPIDDGNDPACIPQADEGRLRSRLLGDPDLFHPLPYDSLY